MRGRRFQGLSHPRICSEAFDDLYLHKLYFHRLAPPGHSCYQLGQERSVCTREKEATLQIQLVLQGTDTAQKDWEELSQF